MGLLEWRKPTPGKAASLGVHLPAPNLGQLRKRKGGTKEGREEGGKEGRIGSPVCHKEECNASTQGANDEGVEGREESGKMEAAERTVVSLVRLIR